MGFQIPTWNADNLRRRSVSLSLSRSSVAFNTITDSSHRPPLACALCAFSGQSNYAQAWSLLSLPSEERW